MTVADAVLFVVDATVGITDADEAVVRILRRSGKPVVLAANKVDDQRGEAEAAGLWNLGLGEPYPVSALHGRGSGDLLDAVLAALPETPSMDDAAAGGPRRVAIVGRPNVGKSSLLNKLAGGPSGRSSTTSPARRSTRSTSWSQLGGRTWRFIDTAGIRKRVKEASGHEYYASLRTDAAIERAEVCVVVVDASQPLSEQDQRIITSVAEAGRALVIAFNKWDLVDEERRYYLDREIERELVRVPVGAAGQHHRAHRAGTSTGWCRRSTRRSPAGRRASPPAQLNSFLGRLVAEHPHPVRGGKQPRILFGTQVATAPPTFVLFTSGPLEASYLRFVERRLREEFGFVGTPLHLQVRPRKKDGKRR